jgi:serine/threonine-protein kinase HipA
MPYTPVDLIEVHAWGELVGALALDAATGYYAFGYAPEWIDGGVELAPLRMPLRRPPVVFPELAPLTYHRLPAMVADALPDRFGNALVTARLAAEGVTAQQITPLDRLAYAADRSIGALEFRPPIDLAADPATAIQLADLVVAARSAVHGSFDGDDATQAALDQLIQVGTSAGGARAKAVICFNPETGQIRSGHAPAEAGFQHWLLKLDGVDDERELRSGRGFGRIEYAYSLMAAAAGVEMAECRLLTEHNRAHFLTRRFDRTESGDKLHTQTLCAIDHLDFNLAATHDYSQYFDVIDRLNLGEAALVQAFRRVVFNVAGANRDDHTKNLSFVCDRTGRWALAPAYDVIHAHNPSGQWTQRHQMSVNGRFEEISRADLMVLAEHFAVPGARTIIRDVCTAVDSWPEFAAVAGVDADTVARIGDDVRRFRPG